VVLTLEIGIGIVKANKDIIESKIRLLIDRCNDFTNEHKVTIMGKWNAVNVMGILVGILGTSRALENTVEASNMND